MFGKFFKSSKAMRSLFRELKKETGVDCDQLDLVGSACLDKLEEYELGMASDEEDDELREMFGLEEAPVISISRPEMLVGFLWDARGMSMGGGLYGGVVDNENFCNEKLREYLIEVGCRDVAETIGVFCQGVTRFFEESDRLNEEERRREFLRLTINGDLSRENTILYSEQGGFVVRLRKYILKNWSEFDLRDYFEG